MDSTHNLTSEPTLVDLDTTTALKDTTIPNLQFITFTNFNQSTDSQTRKKVRQHVMQGVRRNSKRESGNGKNRQRAREVVLDISSLSNSNNPETKLLNHGVSQVCRSRLHQPIVVPFPQVPEGRSPRTTIALPSTLGVSQGQQHRIPSPADSSHGYQASGASSIQQDGRLETVMEAIGQLNIDNEGNWSYHGHGSTSAFVRNISGRLTDIPNSRTNMKSAPKLRHIPDASTTAREWKTPPKCSIRYDSILLPSEEIARELVSSALDDACALFKFVHQPSFYTMFNRMYNMDPQLYSKDEERFLPLLYSVLAVGCLYSSGGRVDFGTAYAVSEGTKYFEACQKMLILTEIHDIDSLQALIFMIIYQQSSGEMSTCHSYVSAAMAAALQMGLHRCEPEGINPIDRELRKRMFWTIRTMEIYITTVLGLPRMVSDADIDQELPLEVDDECITSDGILPMVEGQISILAGFHAHIRLSFILGKITTEIYPTRRMKKGCSGTSGTYTVDNAKIKETERELEEWMRSLPIELQLGSESSTTLMRTQHLLQLAFTHAQMFLYRPFLHHISHPQINIHSNKQAYTYATKCISISCNIIQNLHAMESKSMLKGPYWFSIYTTFCATLSLVFNIWQNVGTDEATLYTLKDAEYGRDILLKFSSKSVTARKNFEMLSSIYNLLPVRLASSRSTQQLGGGNKNHALFRSSEPNASRLNRKCLDTVPGVCCRAPSFATSNDNISLPAEASHNINTSNSNTYPRGNTSNFPNIEESRTNFPSQDLLHDDFDFTDLDFLQPPSCPYGYDETNYSNPNSYVSEITNPGHIQPQTPLLSDIMHFGTYDGYTSASASLTDYGFEMDEGLMRENP